MLREPGERTGGSKRAGAREEPGAAQVCDNPRAPGWPLLGDKGHRPCHRPGTLPCAQLRPPKPLCCALPTQGGESSSLSALFPLRHLFCPSSAHPCPHLQVSCLSPGSHRDAELGQCSSIPSPGLAVLTLRQEESPDSWLSP